MSTYEHTPPTRERLLEIVDELCSGWNQFLAVPDQQFARPRDADEPAAAALVMALSSHVTELGSGVLTLARSGSSGMTLMPLVRAAYESAITAHWLAQLPDAAPAFINEDARNRKAIVRELPNARGQGFRDSVDAISRQIVPRLSTSSDAQARNFEGRCHDLDLAGVDAYLYYRAASSLTHPSILVADQYLRSIDSELYVSAHAQNMGDAWIFVTAAALVWAQMAANYCDPQRTRRTTLRRIGRELGIEPELALSPAARARTTGVKRPRTAARPND
ncbi:DUF5677 domain-containing protein [Rhodococcus sp. SORGH_AS_0301]|uniref:DUF5677 domain-containing protein n=1 Tax=Rhodococcus sp. SORGH_AS_0301 TaxID=3041780 RepID=UPI002787B8D1|nr:DUF5677 domain-containing protein [Rhodococcus sp. SORGH_AS_0301]MDQ1178661.1 hypothetical protein [Rhodococcus sp. SORGH_AS_0301]